MSSSCNEDNLSPQCAMSEHCELLRRWWSKLRNYGRLPDFSGRSVLVAEEDANMADGMQLIASKGLHCKVWRAESRQEILRIIQNEHPDLLVLSLKLAQPDPLAFLHDLHARYPSLAIMAVTLEAEGPSVDGPSAERPSDAELFNAHVSDILTKPWQPAELEAKLELALWECAMADSLAEVDFQYRKIFELNMEPMVIVDGETGEIETANNSFCELTGLAAGELHSRRVADYLAAGEGERFQAGLMVCGSRGQGTIGGISLMTNGYQRLFDVTTTFYDTPDKRLACLAFKDISEKHDLEMRLTEAAQKDTLTDLYNQRSFQTRIEGVVAAARHKQGPLTLMLLDLDSFKACNDKHGHQTGDLVLQTVGRLINQNIRAGHDEGFRCGGDEFAVVLRGADADVASGIGQRLQESFAEAQNYGTSLSIGVAQHEPSMNPKAFIQAADRALYRAKMAGKSCISVWDTRTGAAS